MSLIIDVGHEGDLKGLDPGAVGNGIIEANLVLLISLYQYERFKQLGVPVKITRTKSQKLSKAARTSMVKNSGMKHCISNHINAGGGDGAEVIYSIHAKPTFAKIVLDALVAVGQNARKIFTRKLSNNSFHDYYYMHRETGAVETIIVEYGFLDSKKDDVHQLKTDWQKYAEAVVKAYCQYANYKYTANKEAIDMAESKALKERVAELEKGKADRVNNTSNKSHAESFAKAIRAGIIKGDPQGNYNAGGAMTREEMITVLDRLGLIPNK